MRKPYQLTPHQVQILTAMVAMGAALKQDIMARSGVAKNSFLNAYDSLDYHELVTADKPTTGRQRWRLAHITMAGRRALADHEAGLRAGPAPKLVPPNRIDVMHLPVFEPARSRAFVRNDGHRHIGSRGIAC